MDIFGFALFDIVVIAIIIGAAIEGIWKGLVFTVLSFFSYIISIVVAKLYYPSLSNILRNSKNIFEDIKLAINEHVFNSVKAGMGTEEIVSNYNLPHSVQNKAVTSINNTVATSVSDGISAGVISLFYDIISVILIFLVVRALIYFIIKILDVFAKLPLIKQANKLGGLVAGTAKGIILVYIVCIVITPIVGLKSTGFIAQNLAHSNLATMFYENNIIWIFMKGIGNTIKF